MRDLLFCDDCGSIIASNGSGHTKTCSKFRGKVIPSSIQSYGKIGMLGYYGYTVTAPEEKRRERLLRLYKDKLMHTGDNAIYVVSFGPPESRRRITRIQEIMDGLDAVSYTHLTLPTKRIV